MIRETTVYDLEEERIEKRRQVWRAANRGRNICRVASTVLTIATLSCIPSAGHSVIGACALAACAALVAVCYVRMKKIDKWEKREMRE